MEGRRTRTVVLADARGDDRCLRITWHPEASTVVFSHWRGSACVASTPVRIPELSKVVPVFARALRLRVRMRTVRRSPGQQRVSPVPVKRLAPADSNPPSASSKHGLDSSVRPSAGPVVAAL